MASENDKLMIELLLADMEDALNVKHDPDSDHDLSSDPLYAKMRKVSARTGTICVQSSHGSIDNYTCFIVERATNVFVVYGLPEDEWFEQPADELQVEWDSDVSGPPFEVRKPPKYTYRPVPGDGFEPPRHIVLGMECSRQADEFFSEPANTGAAKKVTVNPIKEQDTGDLLITDGFGG